MPVTNYDGLLEAWADQAETLEQNLEALYGPPGITPVLPNITTCDGMLEAIADETEKAYINFGRLYGAYYDKEAYSVTMSNLFNLYKLKMLGGKTINDSGTIYTAPVTSVVLTGKNLFDKDNPEKKSGFLSSSGLPAGQTRFVSSGAAKCLVIKVKPSTQYTYSYRGSDGGRHILGMFSAIPSDQEIGLSPSGTSKTIDSRSYYTFTTDATTEYLFLYYYNSNDGISESVIMEYIEVCEGADTSAFSPYKTPVSTDIPAEIQALNGYGWSADSAYNYIDFEKKLFVKNVGKIDMSDLMFGYGPSVGWNAAVTGFAETGSNDVKMDAVSENYTAVTRNEYVEDYAAGTEAGEISLSSDGKKLYVGTGSINTVPSGVLYYKLKKPVVTDISEFLTDIDITAGASETLTFVNEHELAVPNIVEFVES